MKIHNVRLGLATNSSSSHSIVILKPNLKLADTDCRNGEFGWQNFIAASKHSKLNYLSALLYDKLFDIGGREIADAVIDSWVGIKDYSHNQSSVDHQSHLDMPRNHGGVAISREFINDFVNFLSRDDVVILGGNDNDEKKYTLPQSNIKFDISQSFFKDCKHDIVCKKDKLTNNWVLFNQNTGTKIRFSFDEAIPKATKSSFPELVDIKITDFCDTGCRYCYQNSTVKGKHANVNVITALALAMGQAGVLEVAIGGGEPTQHPQFLDILKTFREHDIVPNFTTKSLDWLDKDEYTKEVLKTCGGFAYSCETKEDVRKLTLATQDKRYAYNKQIVVHHVVGSVDQTAFEDVIKEASDDGFNVTLLGYKTNGRGNKFTPHHFNWLDAIDNIRASGHYTDIGIDTKLVADYSSMLNERAVPEFLYYKEEGKFSMYIDAVKGKIGPSSYCDATQMKILKFESDFGGLASNSDVLLQHFNSY